MMNLTVEKIIKVARVLVKEKYVSDYSEKDIDEIIKLAFNCLNVILENSRVNFKVIYDFWGDLTIRINSFIEVENNKTLIFDADISFTDDIIEIEYTDKTLIKDKEIEIKTVNVKYDILKYLLNE